MSFSISVVYLQIYAFSAAASNHIFVAPFEQNIQ